MSSSSSNCVKFGAVFSIYVAYVLFRRLPIIFLSEIRNEIPITNDDIGRIVSIHAAACTISKLVFGTAADRTSSSKLFIGGALLCCTSSICLAFASAVWQIELVMAMIGGVQGAGWVPATKLVASWFDDSSYATMFSLLGCGSTFAGMILPLFKSSYWRTIELNTAILVLLFSLICKKWIITDDAIRKEVQPIKKSDIEEGDATGIKSIVKSRVIWHIAVVYFFSMEMRTICETWVPLYLNEKKLSADGFQFLYELGGLIGILTSGVMLDKVGGMMGVDASRRLLGVLSTVLMMLIAIGVFEYAELSSILGFFTGFFVNGSFNIWCLIGSQAGTKTVAGTCSAFISFIASVGAIFAGSPLAHLIATFSYKVFGVLFVFQLALVLSISSFRIPLRMPRITKEKKIN